MQPPEFKYKSVISAFFKQFPKGHLIVAGTLAAGLLLSAALMPSSDEAILLAPSNTGAVEQLPFTTLLPLEEHNGDQLVVNTPLAPTVAVSPTVEQPEASAREFTVKAGDNLSSIFQRAGLNDKAIYELFNTNPAAKDLRRIIPGQQIVFDIDEAGKLQQLTYVQNELTSLQFSRTEKGFANKKIEREPDIKVAYRHATINSSLFLAGKNAGLSNNMVMELAGIFAWDIDFAQDIRRGDQLKVMFEEKFIDGKKIGNGAILAVEFINQGKRHKAVRYTDKDGYTNYYTPEGESMRKAFLRMPVDFARISSHFNLGRKHPILHTIRAHKGTDYAAPRGTPIKAAGDGKIVHAGVKGGYGNTVVIQHGQGYQTLYAHMHNFGRDIKAGARVRQGQVIGYVGTTGLSTGPHLHYEFHVNGTPRNPLTVDVPKTVAIDSSEKAQFKAKTKTIVAQLEQFQTPTQLALADDSERTIN